MARGKKAFLQIAALTMSAMMAFGFAACTNGEKEHQHADTDGDGYCDADGTWIGEGEDPALHEHTYDTTKWAYDSTYHYHAGNCGHDVLKDRERHSFNGDEPKCTVCDYERSFDEIYQMYLGGQIKSFEEQYRCQQASSIKNWSEYAEKGYKLDYDEETQTWKSESSIEIGIADQVVVINVVSHKQYGVTGQGTNYGVRVDAAGKYFVSIKLGEFDIILTRDYGDHTHTYNDNEWGFDAENHWRQCDEDGEKDPATVAPHIFGGDGHCTQEGCEAISQEKCKHEKGFQYNYTKTTLPTHATELKKTCPDCGKEETVSVDYSISNGPTNLSLFVREGTYFVGSFFAGYFLTKEPGVYTVEMVEPVWDDGATLTLTGLCVNLTNKDKGMGVNTNNYSGSKMVGCIYDYAQTENNGFTDGASGWMSKVKINGKPASEWNNRWEPFKSISVTVTQEDIDSVEQTYKKPAKEGDEPTPETKWFRFAFFAAALKEQAVSNTDIFGGWIARFTKGEVQTVSCDHEHLTFGKPATDYKDGTTESNDPLSAKSKAEAAYNATAKGEQGSITATCDDCEATVTVPFTMPSKAPGTVSVNAYDIGTKYMLKASGYMAFEIKEAGTYTLTRTAVYSLRNVVDDPETDTVEAAKTYHYFFNGVFINAGTKGSKNKADAVYYQGEWQTAKQDWYSKIKFGSDVGGSGYDKLGQDTFTFSITVTEADLQNLGDGNSLFVTLGVWYGAEEANWTSSVSGHYEFVEMTKQAETPTVAMVQKEYCLPVRKDF